jgi:hypothetical protein
VYSDAVPRVVAGGGLPEGQACEDQQRETECDHQQRLAPVRQELTEGEARQHQGEHRERQDVPVVVEQLALARVQEEDADEEVDAGERQPIGGLVVGSVTRRRACRASRRCARRRCCN